MPAMSAKRVSLAKWRMMTPAQQAAKKRALGIPTIKGRGSYKVKSYKPRRPRIFGRGSYKTKNYSYDKPGPFGKVGRMVGSSIGSRIAGPAGAYIGDKLGGLAHYVGKIFGSGDYVTGPEVTQNSILSPQAPSFSNGGATVRVKHQEYLGDVYTSATPNTFDLNSYSINPGISQAFPWLSDVCGGTYQQYKLNGMVFYYKSMSGELVSSDNTALGTVSMCTDYDSADIPFTSKQQMENTEFGASCKPSENMIHAIECAPQLTSVSEKYIRAYDNPTGTDVRLYDMGKFYIATQGFQGSSVNIGELWVSYDVTLMKAIEQPPNYLTPFAQYTLNAVDATHSTGTSQTVIRDQIGLTFSYSSGTSSVSFPSTMQANSLLWFYYGVNGSSTASVAPISDLNPVNGLTYYGSGMSNPYPSAATSDFRASTCVFKYDGSGTPSLPPTISIPGGVVPTAITVARLNVSFISSLYVADGL